MGAKSQAIRDARNRILSSQAELQRRALLYLARNTTLEANVRHRAQLGLVNADSTARTGRVKNRCMETGRGRGDSKDIHLTFNNMFSSAAREFMQRLQAMNPLQTLQFKQRSTRNNPAST